MTSPIQSVTPSYSAPGVIGSFDYGYDPASYEGNYNANLLTVGEPTVPRQLATNGGLVTSSGSLRLTYFTARKTEVTTQIRSFTTGGPTSTPTLARMGLYLIDSSDNGTLVASTANDTTLFATINTVYTRSWSTPYTKVAGQRYAYGFIFITAGSTPTFSGLNAVSGVITEPFLSTRLAGFWAGQTDLPASFTSGVIGGTTQQFYAAVLP